MFLACAGTARAATDWQEAATREQLGLQDEWLRLLHYTPAALPGRFRNFVDDPAFFLSPDGPTQPQAELAATLAALLTDTAVQCRFTGRRQWLTSRLPGLASELPAANCTAYDEWRRELAVDQAVLVFAASYLNSPSSMYGHTFLRFDSANPQRRTPLLAYALNFGATIPPDENGLVYAYRGLFGGYPGQFADGPYFDKLREYSRLESRDLWEYPLNLDAVELDRLLAHVWELKNINFDYYFFDENCSLRLLELLDVARPGHDLGQMFPNYAMPIDTVRAVVDAGMVTAVNYRPASRTLMRQQLQSLDPAERQLVRRLADDATLASTAEFTALPAARQHLVANIAYAWLRDRAVHQPPSAATARQSFALLQLINDSAAPGQMPPVAPQPTAPQDGHRTGLLALGAGQEEARSYADVEWRLSYHDLLDPVAGYPVGSSLNMGRLVARLKEGGTLQLQQFDLLEITSLSPRDEFFQPWTWRVNAGWDRQWTDGDDVLTTQVNAGFGWTFAPAESLSLFGLVTGRLEYNHALEQELDVAPGLAVGARLDSQLGTTLLSTDYYQFTDGVERARYALRHNLPLGTNLALRLHAQRQVTDTDRVDEVGIALRYHF
ncbi:MAG: DUF4105 domain-containing protein [Chromatiales bacterium]|nr:DUF4105 domain-containing protein [Chromatiales bacterium]